MARTAATGDTVFDESYMIVGERRRRIDKKYMERVKADAHARCTGQGGASGFTGRAHQHPEPMAQARSESVRSGRVSTLARTDLGAGGAHCTSCRTNGGLLSRWRCGRHAAGLAGLGARRWTVWAAIAAGGERCIWRCPVDLLASPAGRCRRRLPRSIARARPAVLAEVAARLEPPSVR
jgi:hypothetical protein